MPTTTVRGTQITNATIQRQDLDTTTVGQALVTKLVQGTNVTLSSTGADSGTGDVTINVPTGGIGPAGLNAFNITSGSFIVPPVGSTVTVTLNDASWIVVGQMVYVDQAGGGVGQAGALQVTAKTGNQITLLNPTPAPAIPPADATQTGLLKQLSGNTTDFVDGTNTCQNLVTAIQPTIWSARLRSFQALSNSTFEVDQRNVGNTVSPTTAALFTVDRWAAVPSFTATFRTTDGQQTVAAGINVPGTNFAITRSFLRVTLTTAQATLGTSDFFQLRQYVEGPRWRELQNDVHSLQLIVRCSVAPLSFGVVLLDPNIAVSLTKLCTISTANQWQLIPLSNLPIWTGSGNFTSAAGSVGYLLGITLAAGTNLTSPANGVWSTSTNYYGATGQSNFAAQAVNSTFDVAFIQHEPGPLCTTPIDCPFTQNLDDCQRYFTKSYDYGTAIGTVTNNGAVVFSTFASATNSFGYAGFKKPMAKVPGIGIYNPVTGAGGSIYNESNGVSYTSSSVGQIGQGGFSALTTAALAASPAVQLPFFHYTADTGW